MDNVNDAISEEYTTALLNSQFSLVRMFGLECSIFLHMP